MEFNEYSENEPYRRIKSIYNHDIYGRIGGNWYSLFSRYVPTLDLGIA